MHSKMRVNVCRREIIIWERGVGSRGRDLYSPMLRFASVK